MLDPSSLSNIPNFTISNIGQYSKTTPERFIVKKKTISLTTIPVFTSSDISNVHV